MKRPIQLLCSVPFLIALLMAPASDSRSQSPDGASGADESVSAKSSEFQAKALALHEQGDFEGAVLYLDRAMRLDRDNPQLEAALAEARKMLQARTKALASLPSDPDQRQAVLDRHYAQAMQARQAGQTDTALKMLYEIWVADAGFRDVSAQMDALRAAPAPPVVVAQAAVQGPAAKPVVIEPLAAAPVAVASNEAAPGQARTLDEPLAEMAAAVPQKSVDDEIEPLLRGAKSKAGQRQFELARQDFEKILSLDPGNKMAMAGLKDLAAREAASAAPKEKMAAPAAPPVTVAEAKVEALPAPEALPARPADLAIPTVEEIEMMAPRPAETQLASSAAGPEAQRPTAAPRSAQPSQVQVQERVDALYDEAFERYDAGDLRAARGIMGDILLIEPGNARAQTFLNTTAEEWEALLADERAIADAAAREEAGLAKLREPVTIETRRPTPLGDFLNNVSFATGISFSEVHGIDVEVNAKFTDTPLEEVLDAVLLPNGLKWERRDGDIIVVTTDLTTRPFSLTSNSLATVEAMMESGQFQRLLWPPDGVPSIAGQELTLDERSKLLLATDTRDNIERVASIVEGMEGELPLGLETYFYKIEPDQGPKIKGMIEAILKTYEESPEDLNRKIIVDGEDLIVHASKRDIARIEELMQNEVFQPDAQRKLEFGHFNLTPRQDLQMDQELAEAFFRNVQEQISIFLYSQDGQSQAAREGRKMWANPSTMSITLTDYSENIAAVGDFIRSLEQLEPESDLKVIYLKYALADEMESELRSLFGLTAPEDYGPTGPVYLITKNLRRDQDYQWRDLTVRIRRVNENSAADDRDDSVEIIVRTGTYSETITLQEFDSQFIGDYEIVAEEITPAATPGEGRATIQMRYIPPPGQFAPTAELPGAPELAPTAPEAAVTDLDIQANSDLNALIVRYRNPSDLREIEDLIEFLDRPVPQVDISTKMVEVNETRAKEMTADWTIDDLQEWDFGLGDSIFGTRFAQDADEFVNQFEVLNESPGAANLMKGTTVIDLVTGGPSSLNLQLRMLEAEGIINVVNGPRLTIKNDETGDLTISDSSVITNVTPSTTIDLGSGTNTNGTGTDGANDDGQFGQIIPGQQQNQDIINQQNQQFNQNQQFGGIGGFGGGATRVDMSLTPQVTSISNIEVEINLTLTDFANNLGEIIEVTYGPFMADYGVVNGGYSVGQRTKDITTVATVKNGGTIVLGGWLTERQQIMTSGVPVLRNLPYVGSLLFSRTRDTLERTNMLIFLTVNLVPID